MQNEIYIFGAGGLGREAYCILKALPQYNAVAFVESDNFTSKTTTAYNESVPIIGESEFEAICAFKRVCAVIGIGNPNARSAIATKFVGKCDFPNIIHPSVIEFGAVKYGVGNLVAVNCVLSDNITVGNFNFFNIACTIGHDVVMGDCNVVMPSVNISGNITLGCGNLVGAGSFILQGLTIGNNNTVGAGSVVLRKVGDGSAIFGVPAKNIGL